MSGDAVNLEGRRALVTGANRGIGLEVVRLLAGLGMHVFLGARDPRAGEEAAAGVAGVVASVRLDVTDAAGVVAAATAIGTEGVDVVINNAAVNPRGTLGPEEIDLAWRTNVLGPARVTRAFLPPMRGRGWGRIVNVSTELAASSHERRDGGVYAVTKVALNALTRVSADELAGTGILVNAVSPGWCRTDMGGRGASRSARRGAQSVVWGVTLPDDGPSGGYFQDGGALPW
jgi:NAD(P)-dependent dehydrogenase (short-subunit alcohol dehydrogenase family)